VNPARLLYCLSGLIILGACEPGAATGDAKPGGSTGPALRVVTLAPHLAELMYAIGAGDLLVGVSAYTNRPESVRSLPQVGDAFMVDRERLALLQPDLLLAWSSGTPPHVVDKLRAAGFRIETIRTRSLDDVARAMETIGALTGHDVSAGDAAAQFRQEFRFLAERFSGEAPIRVFYQVSSKPIYTVNGDHYVSELIEICGGSNIFADLKDLAPVVSEEAVLARNPEVMLAAGDVRQDAFDNWQRWPSLDANRYRNHYLLPADEIGRPSPGLALAGEALCGALERARLNRRAGQQ